VDEQVTAVVDKRELLEAGVHFGHPTRRWNPKMKPHIFGKRNGIYIIDLEKTVKSLESAYFFVRNKVREGGIILFVGTKKQAQQTIAEEAQRCGMFYVDQRWIGGLLTNWKVIKKRIDEWKALETLDEATLSTMPKKESKKILITLEKFRKAMAGIKEMPGLPDALFVVDVNKEQIAVEEANKMKIPVIAILDTNCDPDKVDYGIPGNDDAIRSIKLFTQKIADAVLEGKKLREGAIEEEGMGEEAGEAPIAVEGGGSEGG